MSLNYETFTSNPNTQLHQQFNYVEAEKQTILRSSTLKSQNLKGKINKYETRFTENYDTTANHPFQVSTASELQWLELPQWSPVHPLQTYTKHRVLPPRSALLYGVTFRSVLLTFWKQMFKSQPGSTLLSDASRYPEDHSLFKGFCPVYNSHWLNDTSKGIPEHLGLIRPP